MAVDCQQGTVKVQTRREQKQTPKTPGDGATANEGFKAQEEGDPSWGNKTPAHRVGLTNQHPQVKGKGLRSHLAKNNKQGTLQRKKTKGDQLVSHLANGGSQPEAKGGGLTSCLARGFNAQGSTPKRKSTHNLTRPMEVDS